jgi:hypothetical protein
MARKAAVLDEVTGEKVAPEKGVQVTGTVSAALAEAIEDYRWANRMTRADVVAGALRQWAEANGLPQ